MVPKLRFPEFRKAGEWELTLAGKLFQNRIERGAEDLPIYSVTTDSGMVRRSSLDRKIDDLADFEGNKKVCRSDIAYNMMRMWQGAFGVAPEDCMVSPAYVVLAPQKDVFSDFYGQFLKTSQSLKRLTSQSHGLTEDRLRLYYKDFAQIPLFFPIPEEQKKIADCLNSLDELIAAQGQKVEALKTYKRGLMQQLFPRGGETVPRLRFPAFREGSEWEIRELGSIIEIASGQVDPIQSPYCDLPHVGGDNIQSEIGTIMGAKTAKELQLISGKYAFDETHVLYSKIRPALNKVALPDFKGICSADIYPIRPSSSELLRNYLFYLLLSDGFLGYATKHSDRSKIPKVNREALLSFGVFLPCPAEQQSIANVLSSFDSLIVAESSKLDALKSNKQALMQQLFPVVAED